MLFTTTFLSATAQESQTVITFHASKYTVSVLSEGGGQGNSNLLKGATEEQLKKYLPDSTFPLQTQVFLVRTPDRNILIDTGHGRNLFSNLKELGLDGSKIDVILLTHLHNDHIGGLLRDGKPAFPNAEVYLAKKEYDYWINLGERGASQQKALNAYKDKLHTFEPYEVDRQGEELITGITPIAAYGHTPGHTAFLIRSDDAKWLIWGDLTHAMPIQMPCPDVALNFDVDTAKAIQSRKTLFAYIIENGIKTAGGMHVPFPAIGKVSKNATEGYTFDPICLCEGI
ncbi:MAG: MBL fold metallo-hydrolase [Dysgonamonadaceae bacterium]|nr:MBL fold metallo-hydrolase [Dysgonamonadaceae bacterium]